MKRILISLFLCFSIGARAGNIVSLSAAEGTPGQEVTVSLSLQNSDGVTALQVALPLDSETHYVSGSCRLNSSRSSSHDIQASEKDGVLSIMVFSLDMQVLQGSSGELLTFRLSLGNQPGTLELNPSKLVLTGTGKNVLEASAVAGSVTTKCARAVYSTMSIDYGRVPLQASYQEALTITNEGNMPLEVSGLTFSDGTRFSTATTFPLVVAAGESETVTVGYAPTERGTVNETVTVLSNTTGRRNTIQLSAEPYAVNELHVQPATGQSDETVTVILTMNNMDAITGLQADIPIPSQLVYEEGSCQLSSRRQDHLLSARLNDGVLQIIAVSATGKAFTGNDGEIVSFRVRLNGHDEATLTPQNVHLTTYYEGRQQDMVSGSTGATVGISSPQIIVDEALDMGYTPFTSPGTATLTVWNYGPAPLVISRATFSNDAVTLTEKLPVTIGSWESHEFTLKTERQERGPFETTMQLYSNDPLRRMATVVLSGERYAPNSLSVSADDAYQDRRLDVHVGMQNIYAIRGVQFDLRLPSAAFALSATPTTKTSRMGDLSVACRRIDDLTVRVVAASMSGQAIAAGEGEVLQLHFDVPSAISTGSYSVSLENVKLSTSQTDNAASDTAAGPASFQVLKPLVGDVNLDGSITAQDASLVLQLVAGKLGRDDAGISCESADVNDDGLITAQDASLILQYVAGKITKLRE